MRDKPKALQIYKHFKGKYYQILHIARHTETDEELVIYRPLFSEDYIAARPLDMFMSEVDHIKYPDVKQKYRFALVTGQVKKGDVQAEADKQDTKEQGIRLDVRKPEFETDSFIGVKDEPETTKAESSNESADISEDDVLDSEPAHETLETGEKTEASLPKDIEDFLDSTSYLAKIEIFESMHKTITDEKLDIISAALDFDSFRDDTEGRYYEILEWLKMKEKYECTRLRDVQRDKYI